MYKETQRKHRSSSQTTPAPRQPPQQSVPQMGSAASAWGMPFHFSTIPITLPHAGSHTSHRNEQPVDIPMLQDQGSDDEREEETQQQNPKRRRSNEPTQQPSKKLKFDVSKQRTQGSSHHSPKPISISPQEPVGQPPKKLKFNVGRQQTQGSSKTPSKRKSSGRGRLTLEPVPVLPQAPQQNMTSHQGPAEQPLTKLMSKFDVGRQQTQGSSKTPSKRKSSGRGRLTLEPVPAYPQAPQQNMTSHQAPVEQPLTKLMSKFDVSKQQTQGSAQKSVKPKPAKGGTLSFRQVPIHHLPSKTTSMRSPKVIDLTGSDSESEDLGQAEQARRKSTPPDILVANSNLGKSPPRKTGRQSDEEMILSDEEEQEKKTFPSFYPHVYDWENEEKGEPSDEEEKGGAFHGDDLDELLAKTYEAYSPEEKEEKKTPRSFYQDPNDWEDEEKREAFHDEDPHKPFANEYEENRSEEEQSYSPINASPGKAPDAENLELELSDGTVSGRELLQWLHTVIGQGTKKMQLQPIPQMTGAINPGAGWLQTAGRMATAITGIDVRTSNFPSLLDQNVRVGSGTPFPLTKEEKTERLYFQNLQRRGQEGKDLRYTDIVHHRNQLFPDWEDSDLAQLLSNHMQTGTYPSHLQLTAQQKEFVEGINILLFGLETSRNNLSFATSPMTLDLMQQGKMSFENAFARNTESGRRYGGWYPMASLQTGPGNMTSHRNFLQQEIGNANLIANPVHHAVTLKELALVVNWLRVKYGKELSQLKKSQAQSYIKGKFKEFLNLYYPGNGRPIFQ